MVVFHAVRFISCHSSTVYAHSARECASAGVLCYPVSPTAFAKKWKINTQIEVIFAIKNPQAGSKNSRPVSLWTLWTDLLAG